VRAQKVLAEFGGKAFGDLRERNAAGVGGDDGAGGPMRNHAIVERAFDGEIFGDGFDDPVAVFDLREVVIEAAGGDQAGGFGNEEGGGAAFQRGIEAIARGLGRDVQQQRRNSGVGEMGGDAGTHGPGSEDGNTADCVRR
jgi:hypothetical protein